jgi:predicted HTH transcriptional regulator
MDMDFGQLRQMIKRGEDSSLQFKVKFDSADAIAAEVCAFSNSQGGHILVGVTDQGVPIGLTMEQVGRLNQHISNACSQKIDPPASVHTTNVPINGDKIVVMIQVPQGTNKFYMANGKDIWVKLGADKRRARREEIQRLLQESGHLYADETTVRQTSLADLYQDDIAKFFERRTGRTLSTEGIPIERILENLKLMERGECTVAGLLLFGRRPELKRPNLPIKVVAFYGNDLSSETYKDSRDITGSIEYLYRGGMAFLENHLRRTQNGQSFNSIGKLEVPEVALEEAVMNALIHRDYTINSQIRLFVFNDRVEIISPGSLPNTATIDNVKLGIHIERNPIIASLIKDIEGVPYRGIGTGISRILRVCGEAGVPVDFHNDTDSRQFKVVFGRAVELQ